MSDCHCTHTWVTPEIPAPSVSVLAPAASVTETAEPLADWERALLGQPPILRPSLIKKFSARNLVVEHRFGGFEPYEFNSYMQAPEAGESTSMVYFRPAFDWTSDTDFAFVLCGKLGYSNYSGATYDVSNVRRLLEDYPDTFVEAHGAHGSTELYLPAHAVLSEQLFDTLVALAEDYPVYDESDLASYEDDLYTEAWDRWLRMNVLYELRCRFDWAGPFDLLIDELDDDGRLEAWFYEINGDQPESYVAESSDEIHLPHEADTTAALGDRIVRHALSRVPFGC